MENENETSVKVGLSQLKNPTPKWMSNVANGIIFSGMVWAMCSMNLTFISPEIKSMINEWVLLSGGIIKLATKFFGIQINNESQ